MQILHRKRYVVSIDGRVLLPILRERSMDDPKTTEFRNGDSGDETKYDAAEHRKDDLDAMRKLNDRTGTDEFPERD